MIACIIGLPLRDLFLQRSSVNGSRWPATGKGNAHTDRHAVGELEFIILEFNNVNTGAPTVGTLGKFEIP